MIRAPRLLDVGDELGHYKLTHLLGRGAGGLVYAAEDSLLERRVALKLLHTVDPDAVGRLLREARSQAQVDHENVCKVYEVGQIDGQSYIAMQYIEGSSLRDAAPEMTLKEKIEVLRKIADAIHAAHRRELIHRDIKPSNILVERGENGEHIDWKPYVLDFGIARRQAAPGETTTGEVKGTPIYMPPEQVVGRVEDLDLRADVYSLGATLYEILAGQPIFADVGSFSVLAKVMNEEPERLRAVAPGVPIDLESIVMRCLEKDPSRRYATARELSDDLARFLAGDPVDARGYTLTTKIRRGWRRRRTAWMGGALALAVVVAIVFLVVFLKARAERMLLEEFRQEVRYVEELMRHAYSEPLHDIRPVQREVEKRLQLLERRIAQEGRAAIAPGSYALGRGYLALRRDDIARKHLDIAWEAGLRDAEVAYARGRALGAVYQRELVKARRISDPTRRQAHFDMIARFYRDPALEALQLGRAAEADPTELVEAWIALWEERFDDALAQARQAAARLPWSHEALTLEAEIHTARGSWLYRRGSHLEAAESYAQAHQAYLVAAERGRSDPLVYEGRCRLAYERMTLAEYALLDRPLQPFYDDGIGACGAALAIDSDRAEPYRLEAMLHWRLGESMISRGTDPSERLQAAGEAARHALELEPKDVESHVALGWASSLLTQWRVGHGEDPTESAGAAISAFTRAGELDMLFAQAYNGLGYTRSLLAAWNLEHGRDPVEFLEAAIRDLEHAAELDTDYVYALGTLGDVHVLMARYALLHGVDPETSLRAAEEAYERIRGINSRYLWAYTMAADLWVERGRAALAMDRDPTAAIEAGREVINKGSTLTEVGWLDLAAGRLAQIEAAWRIANGAPPAAVRESLTESARQLRRAADKLGGESAPHAALAELARLEASWLLRRGEPATSALERGFASVAAALEIDPTLTRVVAIEGVLHLLRARSLAGAERRRELDLGAERLHRALEENSHLELEFRPFLEGFGGRS